MWGEEFELARGSAMKRGRHSPDSESLKSAESEATADSSATHEPMSSTRWQRVLDDVTEIQLRRAFLMLPETADGRTYVGGSFSLRIGRLSIACMNGDEMNATK